MTESEIWGRGPHGEEVRIWTISNRRGLRAKIMNLGAVLLELDVPDRRGETADIVLGYRDLESYFRNFACFGATVGPNANRIGQAAFELEGRRYQLEANDGVNNLHSGSDSFHHRVWQLAEAGENSISFAITSPHMDLGFPGNLTMTVSYQLSEDNRLIIDYEGICDRTSLFNPTNHSYFNLAGHNSGQVFDQLLQIPSDAFTYADAASIPDGQIRSVEDSPMDFRVPKPIGRDFKADYDQLKYAGGYDHNWILRDCNGQVRPVATLSDPVSGRRMTVSSDLPGIQFYTGNYIDEREIGKGGCHYPRQGGVCLETQYFPNAINVESFTSPLIYAGQPVHSRTVFAFSVI